MDRSDNAWWIKRTQFYCYLFWSNLTEKHSYSIAFPFQQSKALRPGAYVLNHDNQKNQNSLNN